MMPEWGFPLLVVPALILTSIALFVLIYLVWRDNKDKTLW